MLFRSKMCPLVHELRRRSALEIRVCVTGQHRAMLDDVLTAFHVRADSDLAIMRPAQTLFEVTDAVLRGMEQELDRHRPELVLVHGDTTTAFAAALAAFYRRIPVGHVEAGLRTESLAAPFPEEWNRRAADLLSEWCFAPTRAARDALLREGKNDKRVFLTGNTVVDAMRFSLAADPEHPALRWGEGHRLLLFTAHRRESLGGPMKGMFRALRRVLEENPTCRAVFPVHENPAVRALALEELSGCPGLLLTGPLSMGVFRALEERCCLCLTDSGGVQEECAALGRPVLLMRETTERPEALSEGVAVIVGTDPERICREARRLLTDADAYARMARSCSAYGDAHACERIADVIEFGFCEPWNAAAGR